MSIFDKAGSIPVNRTAAVVTSKGDDYTPDMQSDVPLWDTPPPMIPLRKQKQQRYIGMVRGRLTVIGVYRYASSGTIWVCRCQCGRYTVRRTSAIANEANDKDKCNECRHTAKLQYRGSDSFKW